MLPPIVLGVFDQFVGARMLDRYPELYKLGQQNKFVRRFHVSVLETPELTAASMRSSRCPSSGSGSSTPSSTLSFVLARLSLPVSRLKLGHSQVIYVCTATIFKEGLILVQGWVGGQWVWGTTLYLTALVTVLGKAALISECAASSPSPLAGLS